MNKKEILEIRKLFNKDNCRVTRICGCYVDGEKEKRLEMKEAFLSLPEEEMFKYIELFKKTLSGAIGKNLMNMEFPLDEEMGDGSQKFLLKLRDSKLQEDELIQQFYDKVIENYIYPENYLILLVHGAYDIPSKSTDGSEMFDASDYVYHFILCSICPVNLSKPGLCYNAEHNSIEDRIRDWIVENPDLGFLFPAFNDRNTDVHSLLYYSKNAENLHPEISEEMLGCSLPMPAKNQKETFNAVVEETLGSECSFEKVRTIHNTLNTLIEEQKENPDPLELDRGDVRRLLSRSGAKEETLQDFEKQYDVAAGERTSLMVSNIASTRKFEVKTPDVTVQVNPDRADLVETKFIDGKQYLMIEITDTVEVNGIHILPERDAKTEKESIPADSPN